MRLALRTLRTSDRRFLFGLTVGLLASLGMATLVSQGYFFANQARALDVLFWLRGTARAPEIVLVAIDEGAFQRLQERQPLSRAYLAAVVRGLRKSGARLIVLDIHLRRPTVRAHDQALVAAIRGASGDPAGAVVVARTLSVRRTQGGETRYRLTSLFDATLEPASGFADVPKDADGFFRRIPLVVPLEHGGFAGSLALVALARLGRVDQEALARRLAGSEPVELLLPVWDDARGEFGGTSPLRFFRDEDWKINFVGPAGSFLTVGSEAVHPLGVSDQPVARDNPFRDRIAIIGASFAESRDAFPTPRGLMYGLEIHANILHTLLTRSQIQPVAWGQSLLLQLVLCVAIAWLFAVIGPNKALLISLVIATLILAGVNFAGLAHGAYWYDFLTPILAIRLGSQVHDLAERRRIRRSFHQHVGREVADRIYRDDPSLSGQCRTVTILFANLRNFACLSNAVSPERLSRQLDEYVGVIVQTVEEHHGTVIDFLGGTAMAAYGAMASNATHALDAVRTACRLRQELETLNRRWAAQGLPAVQVGIGIHTGAVFCGSVGSLARKKYTVVGDTVTLASQLADLNHQSSTTVLITDEAHAAVRDHVTAVERGPTTLPGRPQTVDVYEILSLEGRPVAL